MVRQPSLELRLVPLVVCYAALSQSDWSYAIGTGAICRVIRTNETHRICQTIRRQQPSSRERPQPGRISYRRCFLRGSGLSEEYLSVAGAVVLRVRAVVSAEVEEVSGSEVR